MRLVHVNRRRRNRKIALLLGLPVALILLGFGSWGFWQHYKGTHQKHVSIPLSTITKTTDTPDETPPTDACNSYTVPATKPRKIQIASLGVDACIQQVGVDKTNAIVAPSNIYLAGWYTNSPLPGAAGVSLIDGHVSGRYDKNAVFAKLGQLKAGATIRIQFGNKSWKQFIVMKNTSYPATEVMTHAFEPLDATKSQLNLITCGGPYVSGEYTNRVLVESELSS